MDFSQIIMGRNLFENAMRIQRSTEKRDPIDISAKPNLAHSLDTAIFLCLYFIDLTHFRPLEQK